MTFQDNHPLCVDSETLVALNLWLHFSIGGFLQVCHLREREEGMGCFFPQPGMKQITFSHSALARTSHVAPPNCKRANKYSHQCT